MLANGGFENIREIFQSREMIFSLYTPGFFSVVIYIIICQSDNPDTIWIYKVLPIDDLSKCIRVGVKVILFHFVTPVFLLIALIYLMLSGGVLWLDLILSYEVIMLTSAVLICLTMWQLPFSNESSVSNAGMNFAIVILNMIILGVAGFLHYKFLHTFIQKSVAIVVVFALNLLFWKFAMNKV